MKVDSVLVVEDSKLVASMLTSKIQKDTPFGIVLARTLAEAVTILEAGEHRFFVALLDLRLPDAPNGEIIDVVQAYGLPVIVFTGSSDSHTRDFLLSKNVVDYLYKKNVSEIDYLKRIIVRVHRNRNTKVLVVDDSETSRLTIREQLANQCFQTLECTNAEDALRIVQGDPEIKLVITDYHMPGMDGAELVSRIRRIYGFDQLAVIGLSAYGMGQTSARLLKSGANDFLSKPFTVEEFHCRVLLNMEYLEQVEALQKVNYRDYLTGLYNRRYFHEIGSKMFKNASRGNMHLTVAMLDIDHFKRINDTYGHPAGDEVITYVGNTLKTYLRDSDLIARYGGEEFCVVAVNMSEDVVYNAFEKIRLRIAQGRVTWSHQRIEVQVSIGVTQKRLRTLSEMIDQADQNLYYAKEHGRNRVVLDSV